MFEGEAWSLPKSGAHERSKIRESERRICEWSSLSYPKILEKAEKVGLAYLASSSMMKTWARPRACPSGELHSGASLTTTSLTNIRLHWKGFVGTKHSSLIGALVNCSGKKFFNIATWSQSNKTFFARNLYIFPIG